VLFAPGGHLFENRDQVATLVGQGVFAAWWDLGERLLGDNAVSFEVVEALAQRSWVDLADRFFEFTKALFAGCEVAQDQRSPFAANYFHGAFNAARF